jgi:hypothetical protein
MNQERDENVEKLLRQVFPPANAELPADLWPRMLRRLEEAPELVSPVGLGWKARLDAVPWFDWALAAAAGVCVCAAPRLIPVLLYHL